MCESPVEYSIYDNSGLTNTFFSEGDSIDILYSVNSWADQSFSQVHPIILSIT